MCNATNAINGMQGTDSESVTDLVPFSMAQCSPEGKGETAALPRAGHSARFSISGRHSAIENGRCVPHTCALRRVR